MSRTESYCYWLGLKRINGSEFFTWMDGSRFDGLKDIIPLEDHFYDLTTPKFHEPPKRDCVCVARQSQNLIARSLDCSRSYKQFACQKTGTETIVIGKCCIVSMII